MSERPPDWRARCLFALSLLSRRPLNCCLCCPGRPIVRILGCMPCPGEQRIIDHNALARPAGCGLAGLAPTHVERSRLIGRTDEPPQLPGNDKAARRRHKSPPYAKETALGLASLKNGATVAGSVFRGLGQFPAAFKCAFHTALP